MRFTPVGVPRTRGDKPLSRPAIIAGAERSPHPRG